MRFHGKQYVNVEASLVSYVLSMLPTSEWYEISTIANALSIKSSREKFPGFLCTSKLMTLMTKSFSEVQILIGW